MTYNKYKCLILNISRGTNLYPNWGRQLQADDFGIKLKATLGYKFIPRLPMIDLCCNLYKAFLGSLFELRLYNGIYRYIKPPML